MVIEVREKGSPEFYREVVNVISQYRALLSNPERKLRDNFRIMRNLVIVSIVMLIAFVPVTLKDPDMIGLVLIVMLLLIAAFCGFLLYGMKKILKGYLADQRTSTVTLDDTGVEIDKEGSQVLKLAWDSVAFVRSFKESTCFFAKDRMGVVISVENKYRQEIADYLKENNTGVRIIDCYGD